MSAARSILVRLFPEVLPDVSELHQDYQSESLKTQLSLNLYFLSMHFSNKWSSEFEGMFLLGLRKIYSWKKSTFSLKKTSQKSFNSSILFDFCCACEKISVIWLAWMNEMSWIRIQLSDTTKLVVKLKGDVL